MVHSYFPQPPPVPNPAPPVVPAATIFRFLNDASVAFRGWNAVYEIWLWSHDGLRGEIIDVGESRDVGERLEAHERFPLWLFRQAIARESVTIQVRVRPTSVLLSPWPWDDARKQTERIVWNTYTDLGYRLCSSRP